MQIESAVKERYSAAASTREQALCCPVDYNQEYLRVIPDEVIERDYGCGDPSQHLKPGETVLDLGSGTGKICFIASQVVGSSGRVIGVDMNDDMLAVARRHQRAVGDAIGHHNVEFRKGRIQDLALDLELLDQSLKSHPIADAASFLAAESRAEELRRQQPLVADESVDVVVSNCVLNLVDPEAKTRLFAEIFRVLRQGGRAVISDIVSAEPVPTHLQRDPELWSGCISGALTEEDFVHAFETAGFHGIRILKRDETPWRVVENIEFRSVTLEAWKGARGGCQEQRRTVIYRGPFKEVLDDDQHRYRRGERTAVCDETFQLLRGEPYRDAFEFIPAAKATSESSPKPFDFEGTGLRHPRETKERARFTAASAEKCSEGGGCC